MFHVEIRQFPHLARAYNLSDEELARIVDPWAQGLTIELQDRRWTPARAKLTIYEGRRLETAEIGMGRGWSNAARTGSEVTEARLTAARRDGAPAVLEEFKRALLARAGEGGLSAAQAIALAREAWPDTGVEELAALSARVIWQLLAEGRVVVAPGGARG